MARALPAPRRVAERSWRGHLCCISVGIVNSVNAAIFIDWYQWMILVVVLDDTVEQWIDTENNGK